MDEFVKNIYEKLITVSNNRSLIYYFELNKSMPGKSSSNFLNPFQPLFNTLNKLNDELKIQEDQAKAFFTMQENLVYLKEMSTQNLKKIYSGKQKEKKSTNSTGNRQ
jgi:hypothetical protein